MMLRDFSLIQWKAMVALILLPLLFLYSYGNAFNTLANKKILIVQNKGGGHGAIGFHLCKDILLNEPTAETHDLRAPRMLPRTRNEGSSDTVIRPEDQSWELLLWIYGGHQYYH